MAKPYSNDFATIKYDSEGNVLWVKRYTIGMHNEPADMVVDSAGNVYVTGHSYVSDTHYDYLTVKYSTDGALLWEQRYNGPVNDADRAQAIAVDIAGNVYVTGFSWGGTASSGDFATVKYDSQGNELWVSRYDGANDSDVARDVAVDSHGNVYVTGRTHGSSTSGDYVDYVTVKYGESGRQLWVQRYNGPGNGHDDAYAIAVDGEDNVYVTGQSQGSVTGADYATIGYDSAGNELWVQRYNGPANGWDSAQVMAVDSTGDLYVTGNSFGTIGEDDYATVKYSLNTPPVAVAGDDQSIHAGELVWLDGSGSFDDNTPSDDLAYAWTLTARPEGSSATLTGADTATPNFVADLSGAYDVSLVVTDAQGLSSDPDPVTISSANLAPTADAGADAGAIVGDMTALDGTDSSDPEDDPLAHAWSIIEAPDGSSATLSDPGSATKMSQESLNLSEGP